MTICVGGGMIASVGRVLTTVLSRRVHNLYDFQRLKDTCSYFRGCPLAKIDGAISHNLPELLDRHRRLTEAAQGGAGAKPSPVPTPGVRGAVPPAAHVRTS